jgi:hypothetical protein
MAFSIQCTNFGCRKIQEPYIDLVDDKIYCSLCEKELLNITPFIKNQMKMNKQYRKKQPKPFGVKCPRCGKDDRPKLMINGDIICRGCDKPLDHLSEPFKIMLRDKLRTTDNDV